MMPTSVRLDPETEALLRKMARAAGKSKSWVVREAVAAYAAATTRVLRRPYDALAPFIGVGTTGSATRSERTGAQFTAIVRARARARGAC
jgi:hypothetical protein